MLENKLSVKSQSFSIKIFMKHFNLLAIGLGYLKS